MSTGELPDPGDETSARELMRADALCVSGDGAAALAVCDRLLSRYDRVAAVHLARARTLSLLGRRAEACIAATHAVDRDQNSSAAWAALGDAMLAADKAGAAQSAYAQALTRSREDATLWTRLGAALRRQGYMDRARTAFDQALELDPVSAPARRARAELRTWVGDLDGGLEDARVAAVLASEDPAAQALLAAALRQSGRAEEAAIAHERAATLAPDDVDLQRSRATTLLAAGRLSEGFLAWQAHGGMPHADPLPRVPLWRGEPLEGRTIAVSVPTDRSEALLLLRFVADLAQRGARVILRADPSLHLLLRGASGVAALEGPLDEAVGSHFQAPLAAVPALLAAGDEATLSGQVPYLTPDPGRRGLWHTVLVSAELRVAIAFAADGHPRRSPGLAHFAAFGSAPDVRLLSLQAVGPDAPPGLRVEDLSPRLDLAGPLVDTAAVLASVDLAILPDGPLAHLAGALGVPVWVLLSTDPHWCWQAGRADSPWYPSARLLRQPALGEWEPVFAEAARWLGRKVWNRRQR